MNKKIATVVALLVLGVGLGNCHSNLPEYLYAAYAALANSGLAFP